MLFPQATEQEVLGQPEVQLRLARALRAHVAKLTERDPATVQVVIDNGAPHPQLLREAERLAAALIVIGSHSHSGLKHVFLGEVADSVVRHAQCSILVARPHSPTRQILVATDFSPDASAAVAIAAEHAARIGARLTVACSIERRMELVREMTTFGSAYGFVQHEYDDLCRAARERLLEQLISIGARGEIVVLEGRPAAAVVHAAGERDADLLIIGGGGVAGLKRLFLGDVALQIVRSAPCSVLVVRAA
jgi:nucleotide-binding universal stress UspA family protein